MNVKNRQSNFELLRIFATFLIILEHYTAFINYNDSGLLINRVLYIMLGVWGGVGVDIFIVISCWFLSSENAHFSLAKLYDLCKVVILYSLIWYFGLVLKGDYEFSVKWLIKMFLTPFIGSYWFITAFILFYMLCPIMNILVNKISNEQLRKVFLVLTIVFLGHHNVFGGETPLLGIISTFCYIYFFISYLRRCPGNIIERYCGKFTVLLYILIVTSVFLLKEIGKNNYVTHFIDRSTVFIILLAVSIFYLFKRLDLKNQFINLMAGSVFAVYIMHQFWWGHHYIWEIAKVSDAYASKYFIFYMPLTSFLILIICTLLDFVRRTIDLKLKKTKLSKWIYNRITFMDGIFIVK